jgi:hypothetical protein
VRAVERGCESARTVKDSVKLVDPIFSVTTSISTDSP